MGEPSVRACPFCEGEVRRLLYAGMRDRLGLYPHEFSVLECSGCGTLGMDNALSSDELKGLYPEEYIIKEDKGRVGLMWFWKRAERWLFYDRMYRRDVRVILRDTGLARGRVLDVGCGNGGRLISFAKAGFDVEGIETSSVDVDYIKDNLGFNARCGTLQGLDFGPGEYSLITFYNVFEHLPDPVEAVEKAYSLLMPGGYIMISGPFADSVQSRLFGRRWIEVAEMPRHVYLPTTRGLSELLGRCGFSVLEITAESVFKLAHTMAESLLPQAIGSDAYRKGRIRAMLFRAAGAAAMLLSLPLAFLESLSGQACTRMVLARKTDCETP